MASTILSSYEEWIKGCCLSAENAIHPINQKETKRAFSEKFKELVSNIKSDVVIDGTTKKKVTGLYNFASLATATILFKQVEDKDFSKILQANYYYVCGFFWEQLSNTKPSGILQLLEQLNSLFVESSVPVAIRENLSSVWHLALKEIEEFVRTDTVPDVPGKIPYTLTVLTNVFFIGAVNNSYGFSSFLVPVLNFLHEIGYRADQDSTKKMILWGTGKTAVISDTNFSRVKNGLGSFTSLLPKGDLKKKLKDIPKNQDAKAERSIDKKKKKKKKVQKDKAVPTKLPNKNFGRKFTEYFLNDIKVDLQKKEIDDLYTTLLRQLTKQILRDNRIAFVAKQRFSSQYYQLLSVIEENAISDGDTIQRNKILSRLTVIENELMEYQSCVRDLSQNEKDEKKKKIANHIKQLKAEIVLFGADEMIQTVVCLVDNASGQLQSNLNDATKTIEAITNVINSDIPFDNRKIVVSEFLTEAFRLAILVENVTVKPPWLIFTTLRVNSLLNDEPELLLQELKLSEITLGNNRDFDPTRILEDNYFRRLIVAAEGGMGKSTFLRKICKDAVLSDFFSAVIYISLPSLFPPEGKKCPDPTTDEYYYFTTRLLNNFSKDETDMILSLCMGERDYSNPVLIVLDGYNELVSCSDTTRLPEIKAEIGRISKDFNNAYIIVSTRPVEKSSPEEIYAYDFGKKNEELQRFSYTATISGVTDDDIKKLKGYDPFTEEIKTLARIPLYYNMLASGLSETPKTKYELLYHKLWADCNQQTSTSLKAVNDPQSFRLSYMVAAPYIARMACTRPGYRLSRNEILEAIDKGKQIFPVLYWDCFKETLGSCLPADIFAVLTNNEILISENSAADEYAFPHQDWAEFMCAFSLVSEIEWLKKNYHQKKIALLSDVSINFPETVNVFLRQGLKITDGSEEEKIASFKAAFKGIKYTGSGNNIQGELKLASAILQCGNILDISPNAQSLLDALHELFGRLVDLCLQNYDPASGEFPDDTPFDCLLDVTVKECEYYRRKYDFSKDLIRIRYAQSILAGLPDAEYLSQRSDVANQYAKALLYYHSRTATGQPPVSPVPGYENDPERLWNDGFGALQENAATGSVMSSNLLGCVCATPVPYLVRCKARTEIDPVQAYNVYERLLRYALRNELSGNTIAYTVRSIVGLLVKGYVAIDENGHAVKGNCDPCAATDKTKEAVTTLLDKAWGSEKTFFPFLRGWQQLYCVGDQKEARRFFSQETGNIMNNILLKYRFHEETENEIREGYRSLSNKIKADPHGKIDLIHSIYLYIDAKNLELAWAEGEEKEDRIQFYQEFESELNETCKTIVKLYEQYRS